MQGWPCEKSDKLTQRSSASQSEGFIDELAVVLAGGRRPEGCSIIVEPTFS